MIANGADSVVGGYQRNLVFHHFNCSSGTQRIELVVVSLHLKSGYVHPHRSLPCSDVIRLCEVQDVIAWIKDWRERDEGKNAQVPVLIAGDLNESCDQSAVQHLIKSLDLVDLVEQDWVSRDRRPSYSWFTKSTKGRLDYLLADRASCALVVENSVRIHVSAAMRKASDHYPVTVDLAVDLAVDLIVS